jgi:hypothetical protein
VYLDEEKPTKNQYTSCKEWENKKTKAGITIGLLLKHLPTLLDSRKLYVTSKNVSVSHRPAKNKPKVKPAIAGKLPLFCHSKQRKIDNVPKIWFAQ